MAGRRNLLIVILVLVLAYLFFFRRTSGLGLAMQGAGQRNSTMVLGGMSIMSTLGQNSSRALNGADF